MKESVLGFDTSNYTTSCSVFDGTGGENSGRLLDVAPGELGMRQSEALFSHVKRLADLADKLSPEGKIIAVGASEKPRETEDSYMPCFLAGVMAARTTAHFLGVPYYGFSHQQGHIAAALWSAGRLDLMEKEHLAWHLSGGTTELLYVKPEGVAVRCEIIGGTDDVTAGQTIDRAGQMLGLQFPAGKALDALSAGASDRTMWAPRVKNMNFSLSGIEHKMKQMVEAGASKENVAYFTLRSIAETIIRATDNAKEKYGDIPVLFAGGVSSNSLLRETVKDGIFAEPRFSTDNAMGIAVLTMRAVKDNA